MSFTDYIKSINYLHVRKKIFRREVETAFFTHKPFKLPGITRIKISDVEIYKTKYPFSIIKNNNDVISEGLLKIESEKEIINDAENTLNNRYNFFGNGYIDLGENINWHHDYNGNYTWEKSLYWKSDFFSFPKGVDIYYPWLLARFHQGLWLGKAYLITNDEKYIDKFLELFKSFISLNPFCVGIHWLSSSEVAIRLINILYSFAFFINSEKIDERIINSLIEFVLYHAIYIENNLEYSSHRDYRYLLDLLGLSAAGLLLINSSYGNKIFHFAADGFEEDIRKLAHAAGVNVDRSVPIHFLNTECLYLAKIILEKGNYTPSDGFNNLLKKMFNTASVYLRDDESIPLTGDLFPGRILSFKPSSNFRYSYIMPVGSSMYKEKEWKYFGKTFSAELLFLLGLESFDNFSSIKFSKIVPNSIAFNDVRHYILRSNDTHLFIEAGEISKYNSSGHYDTFTFELFYKGEKMIVDPGMFSKYSDEHLYTEMKSEKFHNTVTIDDESFADNEGLFSIKGDITKPKTIEWLSNNEEDILSAQHYAYSRLVDPVICKRTFHFLKHKKLIRIKDEFLGGQKHKALLSFHFHPDVTIEKISEIDYTISKNKTNIILKIITSSENYSSMITDTFYSESYGKIAKSKKICVVIKEIFPAFIITELHLL